MLATGVSAVQAQLKVGNNPGTINANSVLEVESTNKGLLLPRIALTSTTAVAPLAAHVAGMTVYNTATAGDVTPGYYYNDGTKWVRVGTLSTDVNIYNANGTLTGARQVTTAGFGLTFISGAANQITYLATGRTATEAEYGVAGGANQGLTGTVAGDAFLKTYTTSKLFLGTKGAADMVYVTNDAERMRVTSGGSVGIGTASPAHLLHLSSAAATTSIGIQSSCRRYGLYSRNDGAAGCRFSLTDETGGAERFVISAAGLTGIGTSTPAHNLHVFNASGITSVGIESSCRRYGIYSRNDGAAGCRFSVTDETAGSERFVIDANGLVGVNTSDPLNNFHIFSSGTGTSLGLESSCGRFAIASRSDGPAGCRFSISDESASAERLMITSQGYVGIRLSGGPVTAPKAPLHVGTYTSASPFASYTSQTAQMTTTAGYTFSTINPGATWGAVSILAEGNIVCAGAMGCTQTLTYSDARLKDIKGTSDAQHDLTTLMKLQVTDYEMKDKLQFGHRAFKKVVAQQVEEVFPQAVSKQKNIIPNIQSMAEKIEKTDEGILITISAGKQLETNATTLKVFVQGEEGQRDLEIVKQVSANQLLVKGELPAGKQVFVYGEEVNDLRAVDYEALSVLNISATQELARQLAAQNDEIKELKAAVEELKKESTRLDAANKSFAATYAQLDARVSELQKMVEKNKK